MSLSRTLGTLLALLTLGLIPGPSSSAGAADNEVTISHHFTLDLGRDAITRIFTTFEQKTGVKVVDNPTGHEDFKAAILVMAASQNLPDVSATGPAPAPPSWWRAGRSNSSTTCTSQPTWNRSPLPGSGMLFVWLARD
jgi:ABC-type glycerol-3-phosphate transport system substrate-binding protein